MIIWVIIVNWFQLFMTKAGFPGISIKHNNFAIFKELKVCDIKKKHIFECILINISSKQIEMICFVIERFSSTFAEAKTFLYQVWNVFLNLGNEHLYFHSSYKNFYMKNRLNIVFIKFIFHTLLCRRWNTIFDSSYYKEKKD